MNKVKFILTAVICAVAFVFVSLFGIAKFITSKVIQAVSAGVLAAVLWLIFYLINRSGKRKRRAK